MFILISVADNTGTHRDLIKDTVHETFIFAALAKVPTSIYSGKEAQSRLQCMFNCYRTYVWKSFRVFFFLLILKFFLINRALWEMEQDDVMRRAQIKEKAGPWKERRKLCF